MDLGMSGGLLRLILLIVASIVARGYWSTLSNRLVAFKRLDMSEYVGNRDNKVDASQRLLRQVPAHTPALSPRTYTHVYRMCV